MIRFETVNELALKVTCQGGGVLYTKAGAFIAGESAGGKNYTFEKVLFGPQQGLLQAAFGALTRRMAGENLPLMKVNFGGDSQTYYANAGQHVTAYQLARRSAVCGGGEHPRVHGRLRLQRALPGHGRGVAEGHRDLDIDRARRQRVCGGAL